MMLELFIPTSRGCLSFFCFLSTVLVDVLTSPRNPRVFILTDGWRVRFECHSSPSPLFPVSGRTPARSWVFVNLVFPLCNENGVSSCQKKYM